MQCRNDSSRDGFNSPRTRHDGLDAADFGPHVPRHKPPQWDGVVLLNKVAGGMDRLRSWFPEREFFMRSQGQVRFVTVTSRMQMTAAGIAGAASLAFVALLGGAAFSQYQANSERASLLEREAQVATAETRFDAYSDDLAATVADLEARQKMLDGIVDMLPADVVQDAAAEHAVSDSSEESAELISMMNDVFPQAVGLAEVEARQLAAVEALTLYLSLIHF